MRFPALSRHANCDWLICLSALTAIGQSNNDDASVFVFRRQTATKVTKDLRSLLLIATRQPNVFRAFNRVIILESFLRTRYYRKNSRKGSAPKLCSYLSIYYDLSISDEYRCCVLSPSSNLSTQPPPFGTLLASCC